MRLRAINKGLLLWAGICDTKTPVSGDFTRLEFGRAPTNPTFVSVSSVYCQVWTGTVTDPEQADDELVPRVVSMTWGDVCDVEASPHD